MAATTTSIPLFATRPALEPLLPAIAERQRAVLQSGRYILGPEVEAFEAEFAAYLGAGHAVGVANGTEAITIALRALGVGPGDDVVVPGVSFFATAEAVVNAGARPVFCDIDPAGQVMTAAGAEPAITPRTTALLPVHLFGNPAPMAELMELAAAHNLKVCEDAAQAAGARLGERMAGNLGHAASFSFYPGKNLGAVGDGGAVVTNDPEVAQAARRLRFHGSKDKSIHTEVGYNSRLDEIQAAALRVCLPHLEAWTQARRAAATAYAQTSLGDHVTLPTETPNAAACHHLYVVCTEDRDALRQSLAGAGIESRPYYTTPLHQQPAMAPFNPPAFLPNAERLGAQNLALPMGPSLTADQVEAVAAAVAQAGLPAKKSRTA